MQCPEVWARMAMLSGDLKTAEGIYLEQGDIESALKMYQKLHMWDEVITLAERRNYHNLKDLKQKQMSFLLETGIFILSLILNDNCEFKKKKMSLFLQNY